MAKDTGCFEIYGLVSIWSSTARLERPLRPRDGCLSLVGLLLPSLRSSSSLLPELGGWLCNVTRLLVICARLESRLVSAGGLYTHDLTPPIRPRLYPVAKSLLAPCLGMSKCCRWLKAVGLVTRRSVWLLLLLRPLAGLPGLLCQRLLSSLVSSVPVVVQLFLILSRSSLT